MSNIQNYRELFKVIIKGDQENTELQDYIVKILPEKASDEKYIEKIFFKVCDIYEAMDLNVNIYWIADNYISMLREVKTF
ncbi:MAG: hypothetical protein ACRC3Y_09530 [Romboutsia sp.]|uniref:hypothetical protein n=1 Tax=Romboutsia sp. TaxID=1965302 RepID=UPI003F39B15F